ncbi:MAG: type II toxin-antitoxin system Phd/YefM family antitoxin [Chloroflexi bacterium]|nr:type II toxin-antitoxin system Phd/YefM family antitoxin [Chloroflexota bacterium]
MVEILRTHFVGMHELRKDLTKLLEALQEEGQEVVITRQGKPMAVIVDLEKYLEVQQAMREFSHPEYLANLLEARREIREGKGVPAEEVFRRKGL